MKIYVTWYGQDLSSLHQAYNNPKTKSSQSLNVPLWYLLKVYIVIYSLAVKFKLSFYQHFFALLKLLHKFSNILSFRVVI